MAKTKSRPSAARRSGVNVCAGLGKNRASFNDLWNSAHKSPMFLKPQSAKAAAAVASRLAEKKKGAAIGKKTKARKGASPVSKQPAQRTYRFLSNNSIKTLASGSASVVCQRMMTDAMNLRTDVVDESTRGPFLPSFSAGFIRYLENFLCSYVQEVVHDAVCIKNATPKVKHTKLSAKLMRVALKTANERIFALRAPPSGLWDADSVSNPAVAFRVAKKSAPRKDGKKEEKKKKTKEDAEEEEAAPDA